jgi:hypothetical protein
MRIVGDDDDGHITPNGPPRPPTDEEHAVAFAALKLIAMGNSVAEDGRSLSRVPKLEQLGILAGLGSKFRELGMLGHDYARLFERMSGKHAERLSAESPPIQPGRNERVQMSKLWWNRILHGVVAGAAAVIAVSTAGLAVIPVGIVKVAAIVGLVAAKVAPGLGKNAPDADCKPPQ